MSLVEKRDTVITPEYNITGRRQTIAAVVGYRPIRPCRQIVPGLCAVTGECRNVPGVRLEHIGAIRAHWHHHLSACLQSCIREKEQGNYAPAHPILRRPVMDCCRPMCHSMAYRQYSSGTRSLHRAFAAPVSCRSHFPHASNAYTLLAPKRLQRYSRFL